MFEYLRGLLKIQSFKILITLIVALKFKSPIKETRNCKTYVSSMKRIPGSSLAISCQFLKRFYRWNPGARDTNRHFYIFLVFLSIFESSVFDECTRSNTKGKCRFLALVLPETMSRGRGGGWRSIVWIWLLFVTRMTKKVSHPSWER